MFLFSASATTLVQALRILQHLVKRRERKKRRGRGEGDAGRFKKKKNVTPGVCFLQVKDFISFPSVDLDCVGKESTCLSAEFF